MRPFPPIPVPQRHSDASGRPPSRRINSMMKAAHNGETAAMQQRPFYNHAATLRERVQRAAFAAHRRPGCEGITRVLHARRSADARLPQRNAGFRQGFVLPFAFLFIVFSFTVPADISAQRKAMPRRLHPAPLTKAPPRRPLPSRPRPHVSKASPPQKNRGRAVQNTRAPPLWNISVSVIYLHAHPAVPCPPFSTAQKPPSHGSP